MKRMTPIAYELGNALLERHRRLCAPLDIQRSEEVTRKMIDDSVISYKTLCESINAGEVTHGVGKFLFELAKWCEASGVPPINSLAVSAQSKNPGTGYFLAPGGEDWDLRVKECIAYKSYPYRLPPNP